MDLSSLTPDKQVKLQYWLDVIRQCRASGLTNQLWCEQHDISVIITGFPKFKSLPWKNCPERKTVSTCVQTNNRLFYRDWLVYIVHRFKKELLKQRYLHIGETHIQVLKEPGQENTSDFYMWICCNMKDTVNSIRYSEYQLGRSEKYTDTFLKGYEGNIHTDAYSGYNVVSGVKRYLCYTGWDGESECACTDEVYKIYPVWYAWETHFLNVLNICIIICLGIHW